MAGGEPYLVLEYIGTAAYAVSGATVAVRAGMDWLGAAVLAVVAAVGGGTLRDLLLGRLPVGWRCAAFRSGCGSPSSSSQVLSGKRKTRSLT
jgi:uncharacterized membrane protein YeiH